MKSKIWLLGIMALLGAFLLVFSACGEEATPTPTPRPLTPTPVPATPTPIPPTPTLTPVPKSPEQIAYEKALAEFQAVEAAGKKEGKVVMYNASSRDEQLEIMAAFEKRYPEIKLDILKMGTGPRQQRFTAEFQTGQCIADATLGGVNPAYDLSKIPGLAMDLAVLPVFKDPGASWAFPWKYPDPEAKIYTYALSAFPPLYNTKLLTDTSVPRKPQSILELTQPEWKGKFNLHDPRIAGPGRRLFWIIYLEWGPEKAKAFLNNAVLLSDYTEEARSVARGEYLVSAVLGTSSPKPLMQEGAPVDFLLVKEGVVTGYTNAMVAACGPHPNAAKVFMNWLFTAEGQRAVGANWNMPVRAGAESAHPIMAPNVQRFPQTPNTPEWELKWQDAMWETAKKWAEELGK